MNRRLPSREIHLDFHTSEHIEGIGSKFDKKQFQEALKLGNVNSITVFAKCHHGYCYYPSEVGEAHPHLEKDFDFTGAMIDACHEIGVFAPIYITLGWSAKDAIDHPEWVAKKKDGSFSTRNYDVEAKPADAKPECSWLDLCSAGGYFDYMCELTEEICKRYKDVDGIFFDIVYNYDVCYCESCLSGMKELGLDADNNADARKYYEIKKHELVKALNTIIEKYHPDSTIFYNSGGAEINKPQWHYANTHFELEDLPTTWGGYDKMPIRAKYFARKGKDYLGMTGKFHRSWGEFGGFKTPEALKYEFGALCTYGARISTGDQMHPTGFMDMETYRIIGEGYRYVESIEDYIYDVDETTKLGVIISRDMDVNEGLAKLLLDCHQDFDIVHSPDDFARFDAVVIPDEVHLDSKWAKAVNQFIAAGNGVVMLGGSGLGAGSDEFAVDCGLQFVGKSSYDKDFITLGDKLSADAVTSPFLCYDSAYLVEGEGEVLANVREPYFSRTYEHYCSHYNTPYKLEDSKYPAVIKNDNVVYLAHPYCKMYKDFGVTYHRKVFEGALDMVYQSQIAKVALPTSGRMRFVDQKDSKRYVLHILYANPTQRGGVSVVEDLPEIRNVEVELNVDKKIKKVYTAPQMNEVPFEQLDNKVVFTIDNFTSHQVVVIDY